MKRSVCIISFSPIARDARVLRQIEYLAPHYDLTVIGYGDPPSIWYGKENIRWVRLPEREWHISKRIASRLTSVSMTALNAMQAPGVMQRSLYESWYWGGPSPRDALQYALQSQCHAYHANDWTALPVAAEAAKRNGAKLVFDAHEYAPLEYENRWLWKTRIRPAIIYILRKYSPQVDAFTTVCAPIGERFKQEFGLEPTIVLNAPKIAELPAEKSLDASNIRLIHHGGAFRDRHLEKMIQALAFCDPRYSLHFMLVGGHPGYIQELKELADQLAPGRVVFHPPVPPDRIVQELTEYDIGFCMIEPTNYNYHVALPNKFFDFIVAGLAVCVGPSPAMAEIVRQYELGCVTPSFGPGEVAATLNRLDVSRIAAMQRAARKAAKIFNADVEMAKVIALYRQLL